jgi:hypothetical protein
VFLFARNSDAEEWNKRRLQSIEEEEAVSEASDVVAGDGKKAAKCAKAAAIQRDTVTRRENMGLP